ncbi:MAG TPA: hypothetical protein VE084_23665 [Burkholderiaceae bacterium]|nr:hypothetical protein [Burkholderiaceae bacterium]
MARVDHAHAGVARCLVGRIEVATVEGECGVRAKAPQDFDQDLTAIEFRHEMLSRFALGARYRKKAACTQQAPHIGDEL